VKLFPVVLLYLVSCCVFFCATTSSAVGQSAPGEPPVFSGQSSSANPLINLCRSYNALNTRIRDNRIDTASARIQLKRTLAEVRDEYFRVGGIGYPKSAWVFPLAGYDPRAIDGGRRHGYVSGGYDFYRGNRHGGHPSFDIFIRDRNQDGLDDRSGTPVKVLSLTGGIVVALEREWKPDSRQLGGRYLWIYDPANDLLVYYAHNGELSVGLGEIVRPGDVLASVGRSGYNAAKHRSPTHLHLTVLRVQDGRVVPLDIYQDLKRARLSGGKE
jgi:murein DD-endopeptidase MepM/ murein hydrolase activator NlpD